MVEYKLKEPNVPLWGQEYYYTVSALGNLKYYFKGKLHREGAPAVIDYHSNGAVCYEEWRLHGHFHRTNAPARIWYGKEGNVERCERWVKNREIKSPMDLAKAKVDIL